jgi:hypothetical protein
VNKSLKKPLFDCSNIGDFCNCGCAEDEKDAMGKEVKEWTKAGSVGTKGGNITDAYMEMAGKKLEMERHG